MKAQIFAQLNGIDMTLEVEAESRTGLESEIANIITNLELQPRGAVSFGTGKKEEAKADTPRCECGEPMKYKEGTSKAGKPYKGWFCTKPQSQCPPMWIPTE